MNVSATTSAMTGAKAIVQPQSRGAAVARCGAALVVWGWVMWLNAPFIRAQEKDPVRYMIVVTGSELLTGVYADRHTHFLTQTLRPLGWRCVGSISVDDKVDDLKQALRFARDKAPLTIVTGGLGPTDTDITRTTLANFSGIALREHPNVIRDMERRFKVPRAKLQPDLRRQAQVPVDGGYLNNPRGTAVGLVFKLPDQEIIALPGPPRELQPMVQQELVPYLNQRYGTRLPGCSLMLRFVGVGQSHINQTLNERALLPQDAELTTQFTNGRVDFTFSLPEDTPAQRKQLREIEKQIREHLGDFIYASDSMSLEAHVLSLLSRRGQTLAIAEVGSGGGLSRGLNTVRDNKDTLAGAYLAPREDRLSELLQIPRQTWQQATTRTAKAGQLAQAVARQTGSQWGVAVGQVTRGSSGPGQLELAIHNPDGHLNTYTVHLRGNSASDRARLVTSILDHLRRRLR